MSLQEEIIAQLGVKPIIDPEEEIRKSVDFLKAYLKKHPFLKSYVLGISGGQDSTLAGRLAQLAVEEMRAETGDNSYRFIAVRLPYGVQADEDDAQKTDDDKDKTQPSEDKDTPPVSKDAAQTTALNHAGLAAGSVTNLTTDLKTEGDGKVYNISFDYAASGLRYKYAVNAESGAIVAYTTEYISGSTATPAQ